MSQTVVAIVSTAGSVGKTVLATHCLSPRMPGALLMGVDTANLTAAHFGVETTIFAGDEFNRLFAAILDNQDQDMIVDVGGSKECIQFISGMRQAKGQTEISHFIVPVMSENKDQEAALKTIQLLQSQKVPNEKIKVVFMKFTRNVEDEFDHVLRGMEALGISIDLAASVEASPLFDILATHGVSLAKILEDKTDYKIKLLEYPKGSNERDRCIDMRIAQGAAVEVNDNLQRVFDTLFQTASKKKARG